VKPILIALVGSSSSEPTPPADYGFGEILSPLRTLESTRQARGDLMLEQAYFTQDGKPCRNLDSKQDAPCAYEGKARVSMLATGDQALPLGWFLSARSRDKIASSIGEPAKCTAEISINANDSEPEQAAKYLSRRNGCLIRKIGEDIAR